MHYLISCHFQCLLAIQIADWMIVSSLPLRQATKKCRPNFLVPMVAKQTVYVQPGPHILYNGTKCSHKIGRSCQRTYKVQADHLYYHNLMVRGST